MDKSISQFAARQICKQPDSLVLIVSQLRLPYYTDSESSYITSDKRFATLEVKAEEMAKKYDCAFVDNEMPYGRVPQGHPVIVDYFYHEEIRGTENTGKRNR